MYACAMNFEYIFYSTLLDFNTSVLHVCCGY